MLDKKKNKIQGYLLLLIPLGLIGIVGIYPLIKAFFLSFTDYSLYSTHINFIAFSNYKSLFESHDFRNALGNSVLLTSLSVAIQYFLGLIVALVLHHKPLKLFGFLSNFLMLPWIIPVASTVFMFNWMVQPNFGFFNMLFEAVGLNNLVCYWFGNIKFAMLSIILMHVWRNTPFYALVIFASLKAIPKNLYEASSIDGANVLHQFFYITLPNIAYSSAVLIVLHVLWTFNNFDFVYLSTGGGPVGRTDVLATLIYRQSWQYYSFGYASALGIVMFVLTLVFGIFYIISQRKGLE